MKIDAHYDDIWQIKHVKYLRYCLIGADRYLGVIWSNKTGLDIFTGNNFGDV